MIGGLEFQLKHESLVHIWDVDPSNAEGMILYEWKLMGWRQIIFPEVIFSSRTRQIRLDTAGSRLEAQGGSRLFSM